MASQANSTTAPIVPVNATMAELFEQWQDATAAATQSETATAEAEIRLEAAVEQRAPKVFITQADANLYPGLQRYVGERACGGVAHYLKDRLGDLRIGDPNLPARLERAAELVEAVSERTRIWEEEAERSGYNAAYKAEETAWRHCRVIEDALIGRPCETLADLKLKARVALPNFHPEESIKNDWKDSCALSLIRDLMELSE